MQTACLFWPPIALTNRTVPSFSCPLIRYARNGRHCQSVLLYNLDRIQSTDPSEIVLFVEGEKCADALSCLGFLTTTTYGGSNAPTISNLSVLKARRIMLWPDNDTAGQTYAKVVKGLLLQAKALEVTVLPTKYKCIEKSGKCRLKSWQFQYIHGQSWARQRHTNRQFS